MTILFHRVCGCAFALFLGTFTAWAGANDYRFELVSTDHRVGAGAVIELLLTDLRTGQPVEDAVIYATRMDMAPDGMATMTSPVTALSATGPGRIALPPTSPWRADGGSRSRPRSRVRPKP